jgi:hypothetical protein
MLLGAEPISVYYDIVYHSVLSIQVTLCPTLLYHCPLAMELSSDVARISNKGGQKIPGQASYFE